MLEGEDFKLPEPKKVYVAIIGRDENLGIGHQHPKVYTSTDKEALIRQALQARQEMERGGGGVSPNRYSYGPYSIFIGEMTHKVEVPVEYTLAPLVKLG